MATLREDMVYGVTATVRRASVAVVFGLFIGLAFLPAEAAASWNVEVDDPIDDVACVVPGRQQVEMCSPQPANLDITHVRSFESGANVVLEFRVRGVLESSAVTEYGFGVGLAFSGSGAAWLNGIGGYVQNQVAQPGVVVVAMGNLVRATVDKSLLGPEQGVWGLVYGFDNAGNPVKYDVASGRGGGGGGTAAPSSSFPLFLVLGIVAAIAIAGVVAFGLVRSKRLGAARPPAGQTGPRMAPMTPGVSPQPSAPPPPNWGRQQWPPPPPSP